MKRMTCKELGGTCDHVFEADTFDEMAELSKQHGVEMFQKKDMPHLQAMNEMSAMMQNPEVMQQWLSQKQAEFAALPNIE